MKKWIALLCILLTTFTLTGCDIGHYVEGIFQSEEEIETVPNDGYIYGESSTLGIDSTQKNFTSLLTSNTYYVIHDNIWYPLSLYYINFDLADELPNKVDQTRLIAYNQEFDDYIPTLYAGDKLVFYNTENILDYVAFERYKDLGWTFPIIRYGALTDGRLYLMLGKDEKAEEYGVLPDSPFYTLYNKEADTFFYIDKIGGVNVNNTMLNDRGLFDSEYLKADATMDFECYRGTIYEHYNVDVNTHAFGSYETYLEPSFSAIQSYVYEITIPDYLYSGYYMINNSGLLRYVKEDTNRYPELFDFNVPLLFPIQKENAKKYDTPYSYSSLESLNYYGYYAQATEGTFGYVDTTDAPKEDVEESAKQLFRNSFMKTFYFQFPKDRECTIIVKSETGEKTGDITLVMNSGRIKPLKYDMFEDNYSVTITGADDIGELTVAGLFDNYKLEIVNAIQIDKPDTTVEETPTSDITDSISSLFSTRDVSTNEGE